MEIIRFQKPFHFNLFFKTFDFEKLLEAGKIQLLNETDYRLEAKYQNRFFGYNNNFKCDGVCGCEGDALRDRRPGPPLPVPLPRRDLRPRRSLRLETGAGDEGQDPH